MAAFIRACSCRLLSNRCQIGTFDVPRKSKCLFQNIGCQSRPLAVARACHSEKPRTVTRVFITDDDGCDRFRICAQFIGKGGANINRLKSECASDIDINLQGGQVCVSGSDAEEMNRVVEKVFEELQRIRDMQDTDGIVKEKVFTDDDVDNHNVICARMIGKGAKKIKQFVSLTGLEFEVSRTPEQFVIVSGTDAEVVKKAVDMLNKHILRIKKFAGIE